MSLRDRAPQARRRCIVELAERRAYLRPVDIAAKLTVSTDTVRRNLVALAPLGELRRVHGGALAAVVDVTEPDRGARSLSDRRQKKEIGRTVDVLVADGDTVFFDVGTTVETAGASIRPSFHGTDVTNSPAAVGAVLNDRGDIEPHVLGGVVRVGEFTTTGPNELAQFARFNASIAFTGSGGISVERGIIDCSLDDLAVERMMLARSQLTFVLTKTHKFGMHAKRVVCGLDSVDGLITDHLICDEVRQRVSRGGSAVVVPESLAPRGRGDGDCSVEG